MTTRSRRRASFAIPILVAVLGLAVLTAGCQGGSPGATIERPTTSAPAETTSPPKTTAPPETTSPPKTTAPPETTEPPAGENNAALWVLLIVVLLVIVVVVLVVTGRNKPAPAPAATSGGGPADWRTHAREGLAAAMQLRDRLTPDLAVWRGNVRYDEKTGAAVDATSALAVTWAKLPDRMAQAGDHLYAAKVGAPDPNTAAVLQRVIDALNATRAAIDARAEARYRFREIDAEHSGADREQRLGEAHDREQQAAAALDDARKALEEALTALSATL